MSESLYIRFDKSDSWTEIFTINDISVSKEDIWDDKPVKRKVWGELLVKNNPFGENTDSNNLYDLISEKDLDQEIYFRHVGDDTDYLYGWASVLDCELIEDKNVISVTPSTDDEYSYVLDNLDTKVDVFGDADVALNGDFQDWEDGTPVDWSFETGAFYNDPINDTLLNKRCAVLKSSGVTNSIIHQTVTNINGARDLDFSFYYQLLEIENDDGGLDNLRFKIKITKGTQVLYGNSDGGWGTEDEWISYAPNKLALVESNIESFVFFRKIFQAPNINGEVTYTFAHIHTDIIDKDTRLYLTDVSVKSSTLDFVDVNIKLEGSQLKIKEQEEIENEDLSNVDSLLKSSPKYKTIKDYEDGGNYWIDRYFDIDGSPNPSTLNDSNTGFADNRNINYKNLEDDILNGEQDNPFYLGEMCKLEVFKGDIFLDNAWALIFIFSPFALAAFYALNRRQRLRAHATFAREESYTEKDDEGIYPPPEEDAGWFETAEVDSKGRKLWVRTPYNGAYNEWQKEDVVVENGIINGFNYSQSVVSSKIYPNTSKLYTTTIDLTSLIEKVYRGTHETLRGKNFYSTFLNNDYPSFDPLTEKLKGEIDDLDSNPNVNYVTKLDNPLNKIAVLHTYDLKTEKEQDDDDATIEISLSELMDDLMIIFPNTYWYVDSFGNLRFEHKQYVDLVNDYVDLTNLSDKYNRFNYDKTKVYGKLEYNIINSGYKDHSYSEIEFDRAATSGRGGVNLITEATSFLTTDVQHCIENADSLSNGLLLVNYEEIAGGNYLRYGLGQRSGNVVANGELSIATTLMRYGTYECSWLFGELNEEEIYFHHTKRTKLGIRDIVLKGIYTEDYFLTNLGIGEATSVLDYAKGTTTLQLKYRHSDEFIAVGDGIILEL